MCKPWVHSAAEHELRMLGVGSPILWALLTIVVQELLVGVPRCRAGLQVLGGPRIDKL